MERKSRGRIVAWVIAILAVCVLVFCGYKIISQLQDYKKSNETYEKIRSEAVVDNSGDLLEDVEDPIDKKDLIGIDWDKFKDSNMVAWVQLDDISYPVYHDDGSLFYLRHLPDGTYATAGSIFLYGENSATFTDQSSFIYGHNMSNGSMFGKLKNYVDDKYKDHRFYIYLPDGTRHIYQFFAVATVGEDSQAYTWSFANDESFKNWQMWMKEMSAVNCTAPVDISKKYVTFSTCNGGGGTDKRLIVCGQEVKVDKVQSPASWYSEYVASLSKSRENMLKIGEDRRVILEDLKNTARKELYEERRTVPGEKKKD